MGIYERQRTGKLVFLAASALAIIMFLLVSNSLVKELAQQERERMDIWASATERLAKANVDSDFEFLLAIIIQNNSI
ncbi:MAG: ATP-binding protein, partial [Muribaculaceae bacterium]|nr:ATP-binding protein [Muribaculaceae bacterium]